MSKFKAGEKYVAIVGSSAGWYKKGDVVEALTSGPFLAVDVGGFRRSLKAGNFIPFKSSVDIAQEEVEAQEKALAEAKAKLKEAQLEAEKVKLFTTEDIRSGMVVGFAHEYRLVVQDASGRWTFFSTETWRQCNAESSANIMKALNSFYTKTTKTLKDVL